MNILIIGSGGREHTIAWKVSQSSLVKKIFVIPGNPGIEHEEKVTCIDLKDQSNEAIIKFALENKVDFAIIGPEKNLTEGLASIFRNCNISCLGPNKESAKLEGSKSFAKEMMKLSNIPTASYEKFDHSERAINYLNSHQADKQFVIKIDGLASGKGVIVCENIEQAKNAVKDLLEINILNLNHPEIIIEERLFGKEVSAFFLCDGNSGIYLGNASDYKRIRDGNLGPNTGGMGAYGPVPWLAHSFESEIHDSVVIPLMETMKNSNNPFKGILFIGIMMTIEGPKVLEFNTRFGDPETQVILPLIKNDLLPYFIASNDGTLKNLPPLEFYNQTALHIVLASEGYPGTEGVPIKTNRKVLFNELEEGKIFFAGVKKVENNLFTSGGRVMGVTVKSITHKQAIEQGYKELKKIEFEGMQYRSDIGQILEI